MEEKQGYNSPNVGTNKKIMRGQRLFKVTMGESRNQMLGIIKNEGCVNKVKDRMMEEGYKKNKETK